MEFSEASRFRHRKSPSSDRFLGTYPLPSDRPFSSTKNAAFFFSGKTPRVSAYECAVNRELGNECDENDDGEGGILPPRDCGNELGAIPHAGLFGAGESGEDPQRERPKAGKKCCLETNWLS
ncbi:hypothetical protein SLE2022_004130 [Rubroshorea leprosula]